MIPQLPRLADYSISPRHGFLPGDVPLERLPGTYYAAWERIVANLQALIISGRLRGIVDRLPLLSTDFLATEAEWQRAYTVLAFISHAYVWGGNTPSDRVPPSISIPFLVACRHLDLPPVATYASVVLWNWKPLFADEPIDNLENLATVNTFTGSLDESWFYLISAAIEARGGPIIPMMLDAIAAVRHNDSRVVTECLRTFAERLDELGAILQRMYEYCDPHVFYHRIRPFLAGSKNMGEAGLPNGVMFDTGSGSDDYVQYSGGSNAQSSLIQFFDLVLGVEHRPTGERAPDQSSTSASDSEAKSMRSVSTHNFITDMRTYMPGSHRRFLEHVASVANIRDYVDANRSNRALCTAFDACLAMLRAFRDKHIQMVSRYIIVKSRESRSESRSISPRKVVPLNLAASSFTPSGLLNKKKLRGTGGTALIPFLKQARDETGEPAIDAWARRLLNNGPAEVASEEYSATYFNNGKASGGASLTKMGEHASGEVEIVGLAGTWSVDDSEGGICHW